ncbi:MAG TPA: MarC family protein [Spirochaetia bacterium]|nr:MarC family protein [Spirochaetia bacterium]
MSLVSQIVTILVAIFIVIDPFGIVPVFIALTADFPAKKKRLTIRKAVVVAFIVLCFFIFAGNAILRFLSIQPGSFFIAGGILMFIVSIDLLLGTPGRTKTSGDQQGEERDDISIFPLAIPMLAGPGAITTVLLYASEDADPWFILPVLAGSVALSLFLAGVMMSTSSLILRVLGKTGVSVIERLMGIILTALSVQFVYDGLLKLDVLARPS